MSEESIKDKELIFSYNLTAGNFLVRKRRFKEAIECYTRALKITPNHETCLTQRSKCYLLLGKHDKALKDSEVALANNPISSKGITEKAESLYAQGEFEYALVCFYRGQRQRPDIEEYMLGIQKCNEAIENSVGEKSGLRFCNVGKVLKQIEEKKEKEAEKCTCRCKKRKTTPTEQNNAKKNYGSKVLLEELAEDKAFLERLIDHPELKGPCKDEIVKEAKEVLEFMQTRQEFWSQQKPLYARDIQKKMAQGKTTVEEEDEQLRQKIEEKKSKIQTNHEAVTRMLVEIDKGLQREAYDAVIKMCTEAEEIIRSYSMTWLPRRQAYLGVVYSAQGEAHLRLGHYREALRWHNKDLELSTDNKRLVHARARALDNLGRAHATFRRYQAAIDAWEQRIPLSKSPEKRTWLFHEIGTCYRELGRYETARFYATKCVKEARRCEQGQWTMRGLWLLAESETHLEVMDAALKHFDQAVEVAEEHGSPQEAAELEKARQRAVALMKEREADRRKAKALYESPEVVSKRTDAVKFEQADEAGKEADGRVQPEIQVSDAPSDEEADSFDDTGSYIDWTDEDTLPPEEPEQDETATREEDEPDEDESSEGSEDGSDAGSETPAGSVAEDGRETPTGEEEAAEPGATEGETETATGETETATGETEAVTAETGGVTGETEATTGETEATTGETEATTGETEATTGETEATTGETEATTGETEATTGDTEATTEETEATTGETEATESEAAETGETAEESTPAAVDEEQTEETPEAEAEPAPEAEPQTTEDETPADETETTAETDETAGEGE